jgi:paraquat-inducible protein B
MNKKVSPTLIGAFVVGALALVVIAVLMFGSGRFFRTTKDFVLYFDGSVNGLRVGAPVKFRGVEIGSVKNILLRLETDQKALRIPVIIELELEKFTSKGASGAGMEDPEASKQLIDSGLRGQLQMESFVTGLLFVGLDFFPDSPLKLVQTEGGRYQYPEIPTQPTPLQVAGSKVNEIRKLTRSTSKADRPSAPVKDQSLRLLRN